MVPPRPGKSETVIARQVQDEFVIAAVQSPEALTLVVDPIIKSVTNVVMRTLKETLKFNTEETNDLQAELKKKVEILWNDPA